MEVVRAIAWCSDTGKTDEIEIDVVVNDNDADPEVLNSNVRVADPPVDKAH